MSGSATPITDNRTLLAKADAALADLISNGGVLQPQQSQRFIRLLIKQSKLLPMCTVTPMRGPVQEIDKIRFNSRVLRAGSEASALPIGDRAKPDTSKIELNSKLVKGEVRLTNELLEDSIEREELRNTIMQLMGEAVSRDVEDLVVNGDTASPDSFLALFNGVLKQATSHIVDGLGTTTKKQVFRDLLKALPIEYRRDTSMLRYLTSSNSEVDYRDSLSDRATILGDSHLELMKEVSYTGIPVNAIPLFPETAGLLTTGSGLGTNILLCDPKNINVGIWRQIRLETDKLVSEGVVVIVVTMRLDMKLTQEDAVSKATNIKVGLGRHRGCPSGWPRPPLFAVKLVAPRTKENEHGPRYTRNRRLARRCRQPRQARPLHARRRRRVPRGWVARARGPVPRGVQTEPEDLRRHSLGEQRRHAPGVRPRG